VVYDWLLFVFSFLWVRGPRESTLFPYTTLFRSRVSGENSRTSELASAEKERDFEPISPQGAAQEARRRAKRAASANGARMQPLRSEEHTSELQSRENLVCRLLLEKKK